MKFKNVDELPKSASVSAPRYLGRSRIGTIAMKEHPFLINVAFISNLAVLPLPSVNG